ncbi:MAG TPA: hypothetical protein PK587_09890 [Syntrophales bacterium]|nr:hypothetical protein [Syntrophales bacterium]
MKRLLIGLLAVGLIAAFSMPALALDVKVTGSFFAAGYWESNRELKQDNETAQRYYASRLQVNPVFQVADGLRLVTRFEALERVWGQDPIGSTITASNARNTADEQNISWRRAYLSARILGGTLDVGYMAGGPFGTEFMDYENDVPRIKYTYVYGPWIFLALTEKAFSSSAINPNNGKGVGGGEKSIVNNTADSDYDKYALAAIYKWSGGEVGGLVQRYVLNTGEHAASLNGVKRNFNLWIPYFKANIGPVYAEGEILYLQGKWAEYDNAALGADVDIKNFDWYLKARYNFGPAYVGGMVAIIQGDDPTTTDKYENAPFNPENGYTIFQPTLVLWNDWTSRWTGTNHGVNAQTGLGSLPTNANIYQIFAGFKPLPKLSIDASYSFLKANERPYLVAGNAASRVLDDDYGREFDIKAAYKIYDNLEYMVAFGYLWTGDYFKGSDASNQVGNDWLLMHKLTLNF